MLKAAYKDLTEKLACFIGGLPEQVSGIFPMKLHCQHDPA